MIQTDLKNIGATKEVIEGCSDKKADQRYGEHEKRPRIMDDS